MRVSDIVMRYGGEEFLIAIADVDESALTASAERVSDRIRGLSVASGTSGAVSVTPSVGIAVSTSADSLESLIARADRALYAAKAAGRNCVVFQDALPAVGSYVGPTMWLSWRSSSSCATSWLKCAAYQTTTLVPTIDSWLTKLSMCARVPVATALSSSCPLR